MSEMFDMFDITEVLDNLKPYTTKQEKDALLYIADRKKIGKGWKEIDYHVILGILGIENPEIYTIKECEAIIFKLREISVSDLIQVKYVCSNCGKTDINVVNIPKMFMSCEPSNMLDQIRIIDNVVEYYTEFPDDVPIDVLEEFEEEVKKSNKCIFDKYQKIHCTFCGNESMFNSPAHEIISSMNLTEIYNQYADISFYSNNGKNDVDSMYPFEREAFIALIQKRLDKQKQQKQKKEEK